MKKKTKLSISKTKPFANQSFATAFIRHIWLCELSQVSQYVFDWFDKLKSWPMTIFRHKMPLPNEFYW